MIHRFYEIFLKAVIEIESGDQFLKIGDIGFANVFKNEELFTHFKLFIFLVGLLLYCGLAHSTL